MLESTTPPTMFAGAYSMLSAIIKRGISEDASMAQADFSWLVGYGLLMKKCLRDRVFRL